MKSFVSVFVSLVLCLLVAVPCQSALAETQSFSVSPMQEEAAETNAEDQVDQMDQDEQEPVVVYAGIGLSVQGEVQGKGWTAPAKSGAIVGKRNGKGLRAIALQLTKAEGLSGSIKYQTYKRKSGWQAMASNGEGSGSTRNVEAVKIRLIGEVAQQYDVLYRTYISGQGWRPWAKNGAASGKIGKRVRVNAIQVKLSPKTLEAASSENTTETIGIRYEARFKGTGWQAWTGNGKTAGKAKTNKTLSGFAIRADAGSVGGGVKYRTHFTNGTWSGWKTDGSFAGSTSKKVDAVQVKLTGALSKRYVAYYRGYVEKFRWLDWAKSGASAGSLNFNLRLEALQIRLVAKGDAAPGDDRFPTANRLERTKTLNGIDISSWQGDAGINVKKVPSNFVIVKATQGNWYHNPYFTKHANAVLKKGKLLGTYHYADLRGSAIKQADYYVKAVKPYLGKCILALDWENDACSLGPSWAKKFMDRVYKKTGVKPLVYMNQSTTWNYNWSSVAKKYKLWLAQYLYSNMNSTGYLKSPNDHWGIKYWSSAIMYQYSSTGRLKSYGSNLDLNKFYGSARTWRQLCKKS